MTNADVRIRTWRLGERILDREQVGGKAHTLSLLRATGYPVPDGFCIPVAMLEPLAARYAGTISRLLESAPPIDVAAARRAARVVGEITADATLPAEIAEPVLRAYGALGELQEVAVRSSASHEDGPHQSFAGQYATTLGVVGEAAVRSAVVAGWASLYSTAALLYRRRFGISDSARMALLVQHQVALDVSGVLFSIDPMDPGSHSMRLEAVRGSCAALVAGGGADGVWRLDRAGGRPSRCVAGAASLLSESDLERFRQLALDVEAQLGSAVDLEWGLRSGSPVVLQARPVTARGAASVSHVAASRTASSNRIFGQPSSSARRRPLS